MSAYHYTTTDVLISSKPCILYSVIVHNDGANEGVVDIYDGQGAESAHKVARLMCDGSSCQQFGWKGLRLTRGLYVDIVERAESAVIEWEPLGSRKPDEVLAEYAKTVSP